MDDIHLAPTYEEGVPAACQTACPAAHADGDAPQPRSAAAPTKIDGNGDVLASNLPTITTLAPMAVSGPPQLLMPRHGRHRGLRPQRTVTRQPHPL
jgi:hypothetical protein